MRRRTTKRAREKKRGVLLSLSLSLSRPGPGFGLEPFSCPFSAVCAGGFSLCANFEMSSSRTWNDDDGVQYTLPDKSYYKNRHMYKKGRFDHNRIRWTLKNVSVYAPPYCRIRVRVRVGSGLGLGAGSGLGFRVRVRIRVRYRFTTTAPCWDLPQDKRRRQKKKDKGEA